MNKNLIKINGQKCIYIYLYIYVYISARVMHVIVEVIHVAVFKAIPGKKQI